MLFKEIQETQRLVKTDAYQMSIGEIVTMYEDQELEINPEFQRLFRWEIGQKSKLIESLLLGIPIPSIFVFEKEDGTWELIDGLQRVSTILEFMGRLKHNDELKPPSILEATKYLPSLHNVVWAESEKITSVGVDEQVVLDKSLQLTIRRSRIAVEILKRPSDDQTKFDLFQRLNASGTLLNAQELRNCIVLMVNPPYFRAIKRAAEHEKFGEVVSITDDQQEKQRHIELAMRFLAHTLKDYDGKLDVEEYVNESSLNLATTFDANVAASLIEDTFSLLSSVAGGNALRKFENGQYSGRVTLVGLEGIAVGVAKNLQAINALGARESIEFVRERSQSFWQQPDLASFLSPGLRGTVRIQRTVPFGANWFRP